MVLEIATGLTPLAMTVWDGGWSRFAGGAAVLLDGPAGRAISLPPGEGIFTAPLGRVNARSLHWNTKNPPIPENRGISH